METETYVLPGDKKASCQAEVRRHREELSAKKLILKKEEKALGGGTQALMGDANGTVRLRQTYGSNADRKSGTELLADQNSRIEHGRRLAVESEGIAASSLQSLKTQRDQITKMTYNVRVPQARSITDNLGGSNKLLSGMQRSALTNKLALMGVVCLLVLVIVLVIYYKK
jgi:hypothetical protein